MEQLLFRSIAQGQIGQVLRLARAKLSGQREPSASLAQDDDAFFGGDAGIGDARARHNFAILSLPCEP
jgi:hypothetical protein